MNTLLWTYGITAACTIIGLIVYQKKAPVLDVPNKRSLHKIPVKRGAGIVLTFSFAFFVLAGYSLNAWPRLLTDCLLIATLTFPLLGFTDDIKSFSAQKRLLLQFIFSFFLLLLLWPILSLPPFPLWLAIPCAWLGIIWSVNLYNFMDGSDGIASSHALILSSTMGYLFMAQQQMVLAFICLDLALLSSIFLFGFNWPGCARLFLGDSGAYFFGAVFGTLALISGHYSSLSWLDWFFLHALFISDTFWTLILRLARKESCFKPNQDFTHHLLLLQAGWSKTKLMLCYAFIDLCIASLLIAHKGNTSVATCMLLYSVLALMYGTARYVMSDKKNT